MSTKAAEHAAESEKTHAKPHASAAKPTGPETHAVTISSAGFSPARQECKVGDTVTWANADNSKHSVKFHDGRSSGGILPNKSWSYKVTGKDKEVGAVEYGCESNQYLRGLVVVS